MRRINVMNQEENIKDSILECIGETPLIRLHRIPSQHGIQCEMRILRTDFYFY